MRNLYSLIFLAIILPLSCTGQDSLAYWASQNDGEFYHLHLVDASKTRIGNIASNYVGGDFGTDDVLYAIRLNTNGFYKIDTATGSTTKLGTNIPPSGQLWMGLAYDKTEGIMYGLSAQGTTFGKSSIYTINEANGSFTLIGSQWVAGALTCIAIDGKGKMFALNVNDDILYEIDKTDGSITEVGSIGQSSSGIGHAMDFDYETETMYLSTFSPSNSQNTLRIVNLTDGSTTEVGDLGSESGILAIKPPPTLTSDFSADKQSPCEGTAVQFTDQSVDAITWSWVFAGGLPPSSSYQNPTVIYNTAGSYDVELTVSDSSGVSRTKLKEDFITVLEEPAPIITGASLACKDEVVGYSTVEDSGSTYLWTISGGEIIVDDSSFQVTVLWGVPGSGTLDLTQTNADSCTSNAETLDVTIGDCVGLEENTSENLSIYPNPVSDKLYFASESVIKSIAVFDYTGKLLITLNPNSTRYQINTSGYKTGIYLFVIETAHTKTQTRIVIK